MKIELKNVKHSEFASHETHCFEATVYKDGKRWCIASNDGQGGCTDFHPLKNGDHSTLWAEIKAFDDAAEMIHDDDLDFDYKNSLEVVVSNLVTEFLIKRDMKSALKKKITGFKDGKLIQWNAKPIAELIERVKKQDPDAIILNCMTEEEALEIWKSAA